MTKSSNSAFKEQIYRNWQCVLFRVYHLIYWLLEEQYVNNICLQVFNNVSIIITEILKLLQLNLIAIFSPYFYKISSDTDVVKSSVEKHDMSNLLRCSFMMLSFFLINYNAT